MAEPARRPSTLDDPSLPGQRTDESPSLDPLAIDRAYRRERARRRARVQRRIEARHSNVRFWAVLVVLSFLTVFTMLLAWREVQSLFGI